MRFTDSPAVELPVGSSVLSFQEDNNSLHVGTSVWPCSLLVVKFIERWSSIIATNSNINPYASLFPLHSKRAIELGTGCGVAGMGFSLLGLHDILLTDIAPVFPALKHNLKRNRHLFTNTPNKKPPRHAQLYWNNKEHIAAVRPRFDIVVAADVVYMEDSALWLVDAMEGLVKEKDEGGVIVLGYQIRSVDADKVFWEKCVERFDVEKVPKENLDQDYRYEESDVFLLRKNS